MRSQVQRFPVDVHDIYADARASMALPERRRWPMALLTTSGAILLGATVGWLIAGLDRPPAIPSPVAQLPGDRPMPAPLAAMMVLEAREPTGDAFPAAKIDARSLVAFATGRLAADEASIDTGGALWPIVLHRAGDGRFYADLSLDGHLISILVDPAARLSRLTPAELPQATGVVGEEWHAQEVVLEHLRLPPTRFFVSDEPGAEAAIGADLLARHFVVEEQFDRLRLVPRQGES